MVTIGRAESVAVYQTQNAVSKGRHDGVLPVKLNFIDLGKILARSRKFL